MAYPIQPANQINNWVVWIEQTVSGVVTFQDWTSSVTEFDFSVGDTAPDYRKKTMSGNSATITIKNPASNGSTFAAGQGVVISAVGTSNVRTKFAGKINDIDFRREVDPTSGSVDWFMTITANDIYYELSQAEPIVLTKLWNAMGVSGEYWTITFGQPFAGYESYLGIDGMIGYGGADTKLNIVNDTMNVVDFIQMIADSTQMRAHAYYDGATTTVKTTPPALSSTWLKGFSLTTYWPGSSSAAYSGTDGTHTSGTPDFKYLTVDYGRSTRGAISTINLTNKGIVTGIKAGGANRSQAINVPYSKSQTSASKRAMDLTTCIYADNTGWNYLYNTHTGDLRYDNVNTYFKFQTNSSRVRNGHGSTRCLIKATYTAGQSIDLSDEDNIPDMVSAPAGGTTGNWYLRFYAQAHSSTVSFSLTPGIRWYDSGGTLLSTSAGTAVNITSATAWTAVTVNAAKPANAVTARAFFNVGTVQAVGNSFYITDAYLGQQGAYLTYDGETEDDATYAYTWTGTRYNSPTQRNAAANLSTLASYWLTRNTMTNTPTQFTAQFDSNPEVFHFFTSDADVYRSVSLWVNGTKYNCDFSGMSWAVTPTEAIGTFNLIQGS